MLYEGTKNRGAAPVGVGASILSQDFYPAVTSFRLQGSRCQEFSLLLTSLKWTITTLGPSPSLISALEDICSVQLQWCRSHFTEGKTEGVVIKGLLTCPSSTASCVVGTQYKRN